MTSWKAGIAEDKRPSKDAAWSDRIEREAFRIARAICRPVGIAWKRGFKVIFLPYADCEGIVEPDGTVRKVNPQSGPE